STRFCCYRTGIGADNLELFEALTRKGGGIFNVFTEADLKSASTAHRSQCLQIDKVSFVGGPAVSDVVVAGRRAAVYPGGELIVGGRCSGPGRTTLVVEGTFEGKKVVEEYPVEITGSGELAPRGWAEIAVAALLELNDAKLDSVITAYCQQFGIGSRVASFLVLENEADYKRLNLEEERGKTIARDSAKFGEDAWKSIGRVLPAKEAFQQFLAKIEPRAKLLAGEQGAHVQKLLALLTDKDCELSANDIAGAIVKKSDVPPDYLKLRD